MRQSRQYPPLDLVPAAIIRRAQGGGLLRALLTIRGPCILAFSLAAIGCKDPPPAAPKARVRPEVKVAEVKKRTIVRTAGQPGFIEAYEQTSLYANVSGFVDQFNVDIGDKITKDQLLVHLAVPDLVAEYAEAKADVKFAEVNIMVAKQKVKVAEANVGKYSADVVYRQAEYKRISDLVAAKSLEKRVQDESYKDLQSNIAAQKAAEADVGKAQADVDAANAKAAVAQAKEKRLAALVGYTSITAPYNGVVVARNVNTGDFVQPASGDLSAPRSGQNGSRPRAEPLYVVARTDKVRIFLDVREMEASGVHVGSKAWVSIEAVNNAEIAAPVTRTSWALNAKTRTLRVEIDVPNPDASILPNTYAYGKVEVKRSGVWALPLEAITELGNQTSCYAYHDGKAVLLPVQQGIDDGSWVEVVRKRVNGEWVGFDGSERIILGDLSQLSDGEPVRVSSSAENGK